MIRATITSILIATASQAAAQASPVQDAQGTLSGKIAGTAFDLPVACEENEFGWLIARTHDGIDFTTKAKDVSPALTIAQTGNNLAVTAYLADEKVEFGALGNDLSRRFDFNGKIRAGGDGTDYEASFSLGCDG